jgi:hypothetical protein
MPEAAIVNLRRNNLWQWLPNREEERIREDLACPIAFRILCNQIGDFRSLTFLNFRPFPPCRSRPKYPFFKECLSF